MVTVVCCSGIMRSASTWSYNVCRELAVRAATRRSEALALGYSNDTDLTLAGWLRQAREQNLVLRGVMKAHVIGPRTRAAIARGRVGNVFTIRDPRDAMASMLLFGQEKSEAEKTDLIESYRQVLEQGLAFLGDGHSLVVRYEEMVGDPRAQIRAIAGYMHTQVTQAGIAAIDAATGTERAATVVARLETETPPGVDHFDPVTNLHVSHLHGGIVGRWRRELSPDFAARLQQAFRPYLQAYGYEP